MKVLIADDEPLARRRLADLLAECPGWSVCAEAPDGDQAWALCQQLQPDLLILDIRMPGLDGLQLARKVAELQPPPAIIFSTAYAEHALTAFQTIATAYLLKPITRPKLRAALEKVQATTRAQGLAEAAHSGPELVLQKQGRILRLLLSRIMLARADQKYTEVYHRDGIELCEYSLTTLEERFPELLRVHRKALVNPAFVTSLERGKAGSHQLRLRHIDEPVAISRRLWSSVRDRVQSQGPSAPR